MYIPYSTTRFGTTRTSCGYFVRLCKMVHGERWISSSLTGPVQGDMLCQTVMHLCE